MDNGGKAGAAERELHEATTAAASLGVGMHGYYLGLDLGQSQDYTALCILEEPLWQRGGWTSPAGMTNTGWRMAMGEVESRGRPPNPPLFVRHLERFRLGTKYTKIVARIKDLIATPPLSEIPAALLIDKTGVGASVVDHFEQGGINPLAVTIHGGSNVTMRDRDIRVPKRDLVSTTQVLLQNGRLKIAETLPEAQTLRQELLNFRMKIDPKTAHDSYEHWREGDHDDLVLATAMACWFREWWNAHWEDYYAREERASVAF